MVGIRKMAESSTVKSAVELRYQFYELRIAYCNSAAIASSTFFFRSGQRSFDMPLL
ncbi:hypothetical protein SAMN06296036_106237 [Pseudobacteriovorax antillogorgiicola]|uniref:Uncharacterized protein n=1 Tax=Pseudobacteriovorax antillogorgiicola TaxID=1513793 RepID=A0A1Y6BT98_9BACT|nr:hypothetical protein SAMN06296036_106237 [Pseudobacteriovorax antillogorgiicola]